MSRELPITVTGGAGGVAASYDDLAMLGRLYESLGADLTGAAWHDKAEAADGDLLLSAVLAPRTFAEAEAAILSATYGPHGLASRALLVEAQSFAFGAVVDLYRTADTLQRAAYESLSYGLGFAAGTQLVPVALTAGAAWLVMRRAVPGLGVELDAVPWLEAHPEVVQSAVNGSGGLLDGLGRHPISGPLLAALGLDGLHLTTGSAAADLGDLLFVDHAGVAVPDPHQHPYAAPDSIQDLVRDLGTTAAGADGALTVQRLVGADGEVRWVVHLPGTDALLDDRVVRNMGANLDLIAGDDTAYGGAVAQALRDAGVDRRDAVLLVGHSQGGMQAAALAGDPALDYRITHVVTVGAPVATMDMPHDVSVLSIENSADLVPSLDGETNPDTARHTTVTGDVRTGGLGAGQGNHGLDVYTDLAAAVDDSADPSVRESISGMREAGFLGSRAGGTFGFRAETGAAVRDADIDDFPLDIRNRAA